MRCGVIGKRSNLYVIRVPQREERENREKAMFEEMMAEDFPKLKKDVMASKILKDQSFIHSCIQLV